MATKSDTPIESRSSIGKLPEGWRMVRFDEIAQNVNDRVDPAETDLEVYVGLEHLDPESLKIHRWGTPDDVIGQKLGFKDGDIIFGKRRAYQRKLAVAECDGICSAHAMVLRAKPEVIDPEFLPFLMQSDIFMERAVEISVGSLSPTINWKTLRIQEFPVPPRDEQRRMAEILSTTVECIASANKALSRAEQLCEIAIADVLENGLAGDVGNQPGDGRSVSEWKPVTLGTQCELKNGHGFKAAEWSQEGLPIIRIQNLNGSRDFNYYSRTPEPNWIVEPGELLYSWAGVKGKSFGPCLWDGPRGLLNQHIYRIVPNADVDKLWLFETLNMITHRIEKSAHGFKLELVHVRKADITEQPVLAPPIEDQRKIAAFAKTCREAVRNCEDHLQIQRNLKETLIAHFLEGRCDDIH